MRISEKCRNKKHNNNNNSDNPLTARRTDGGKKNQRPMGIKLVSDVMRARTQRSLQGSCTYLRMLEFFIIIYR